MPFFIYVTLLCATVCCVRHTGGAETDDQAEATATKAIICKPGDVLFNIAKKKTLQQVRIDFQKHDQNTQ